MNTSIRSTEQMKPGYFEPTANNKIKWAKSLEEIFPDLSKRIEWPLIKEELYYGHSQFKAQPQVTQEWILNKIKEIAVDFLAENYFKYYPENGFQKLRGIYDEWLSRNVYHKLWLQSHLPISAEIWDAACQYTIRKVSEAFDQPFEPKVVQAKQLMDLLRKALSKFPSPTYQEYLKFTPTPKQPEGEESEYITQNEALVMTIKAQEKELAELKGRFIDLSKCNEKNVLEAVHSNAELERLKANHPDTGKVEKIGWQARLKNNINKYAKQSTMKKDYKGTVTLEDEEHWDNGYANGLAEKELQFKPVVDALIELVTIYDFENDPKRLERTAKDINNAWAAAKQVLSNLSTEVK